MTTDLKEKYVLKIIRDEEAKSPRENDNLGNMICFHTRYNLGDEHSYNDKDDFLFALLVETLKDEDKAEDKYAQIEKNIDRTIYRTGASYEQALDVEILKVVEEKNIILPLYLYDHSGITMNTIGFNDKWDSGLVGWNFISHEEIQKNYGTTNSETLETVRQVLINEVAEYDNYIKGNCFGFKLEKDGELVDSCWGFIGELEEAKNSIKEYLPEEAKNLLETVKEYSSNNIQDSEEEFEM